MRKKVMFYAASAVITATLFMSSNHVADAHINTPEIGYHFLHNSTELKTIDITTQHNNVRVISFSLPVDEKTIKANTNIQLYDATSKQKIDISTKVVTDAKNQKYEVHVSLTNDAIYEHNHEYRLLVGHKDYPIKNLATNALTLEKAVQFDFKANVKNLVAKFNYIDPAHQLATVSIEGTEEKEHLYYAYYIDEDVPLIGQTLTNAKKLQKDQAIINYFDRICYVFVTDDDGVIIDRAKVMNLVQPVIPSTQTDTKLTLSIAGDVGDYTPSEYMGNIYITDGETSEFVDLTNLSFQYDERNIPYIEIDISAYKYKVAYYIINYGFYGFNTDDFTSIDIEKPHYLKALYDFANNSENPWQFYKVLQHVNNALESKITEAPSIKKQYLEAFKLNPFSSLEEVKATIKQIHIKNEDTKKTYDSFFKQVYGVYIPGDHTQLSDGITFEQLYKLQQAIETSPNLKKVDKEDLLSIHINSYYAILIPYLREINALYDEQGSLKTDVTIDDINELFEKFNNEVDNRNPYKYDILFSNLIRAKEDLLALTYRELGALPIK